MAASVRVRAGTHAQGAPPVLVGAMQNAVTAEVIALMPAKLHVRELAAGRAYHHVIQRAPLLAPDHVQRGPLIYE